IQLENLFNLYVKLVNYYIIIDKLGDELVKKKIFIGMATALSLCVLIVAVYISGCIKHPIWEGHSKSWSVILSDKDATNGIYSGNLYRNNHSPKLPKGLVTTVFYRNGKPSTVRNPYTPNHVIAFMDSETDLTAKDKLSVFVIADKKAEKITLDRKVIYWPWESK
ncbi:MAG: hypothetical protein ABF683_13790, partial [Sporolactobacillus sp.]